MDECSGYCGNGGGIESVSDAAKIANMIMTGAGESQCRVKYETEIFADRLGIMGLMVGREREG